MNGCNMRRFECKRPDCDFEPVATTRSPALVEAQRKYQARRTQAVKDAQRRYYEKNRAALNAKARLRYAKKKGVTNE